MARRMAGRPTLTQVAERSGVSIATASYVVNKKSDKPVAEETRQRVLQAVEELGYVPNAAAATLRRGRSNIALVVVDATYTGAVSARTIAYVSEGIRRSGFTTLVHTMEEESELLGVVSAVQPHGVGLLTFVSSGVRQRLRDLGVEVIVGYDSPTEGEDPDRPWERAIGAEQARHLFDLGHDRVLYVVPDDADPRHPVARARYRGALEESVRRGRPEPTLVVARPDRLDLAALLPEHRGHGATAAIAHDDGMGMAVLAAASDLGWHVPGDLAVVGADNDDASSLAQPPMSTVRIPDESYGELTAQWIQRAMEGESVVRTSDELPAPETIRRASS